MSLTTDRDTSIVRRLNGRLRTNPAYVELFTAVDGVLRSRVVEPRRELTSVRDPRRYHRGDWFTLDDRRRVIVNHIEVAEDGTVTLHLQDTKLNESITVVLDSNTKDRGVLVAGARYHGFNYFSDTLTDEDYAIVNEWVERFWPQSGSDAYVAFMGFIKHVRLERDVLWSSETDTDEYPFLEPNDGSMVSVTAGGSHYSTSHVQLRYDRSQFPDVSDEDLFNLFYLLAPIQLVLERIAYDIEAEAITLRTTAVAQISLYEAGVHDARNPEGEARSVIIAAAGPVALYEAGTLHVPSVRTPPTVHLTHIVGEPFTFASRFPGLRRNIQAVEFTLRRGGAELLRVRGINGAGRVWTADGGVGVRIPAARLPPVEGGPWSYEIRVRQNYGWRTVVSGTVGFRRALSVFDATVNVATGVRMGFPLLDDGVEVDPAGYHVFMDVRDDTGSVAKFSTDGGHLTNTGGVVRLNDPNNITVRPGRTYRYLIYARRVRGPREWWAYSRWMRGTLTSEVLDESYVLREDGGLLLRESGGQFVYE